MFDALNNQIKSQLGSIEYESASGSFKGTIPLSALPGSGNYTVKVTSSDHLRRLIPGPVQNIILGQINNMPQATLVAGDSNNDNVLNILDYNLIVGCYSDFSPAKSCTPAYKLVTDLNDDGSVNQEDYNFFLREITVQNGQ